MQLVEMREIVNNFIPTNNLPLHIMFLLHMATILEVGYYCIFSQCLAQLKLELNEALDFYLLLFTYTVESSIQKLLHVQFKILMCIMTLKVCSQSQSVITLLCLFKEFFPVTAFKNSNVKETELDLSSCYKSRSELGC